MKIVALCGSYRKGKTIATLIDETIQGIHTIEPNAEVERICLIEKDIKYCTNCMICKKDDPKKPIANCPIQDDVKEICEKLIEADGVIFGTPVNCGTLTAIFKTFYERIVWVLAKPGTKPIKGCPSPRTSKKRSAVLIVSSGLIPPILRWACDDASKLLEDICSCCLNAKVIANIYAGAVEKLGIDSYKKQVRKAGEKLAKTIRQHNTRF